MWQLNKICRTIIKPPPLFAGTPIAVSADDHLFEQGYGGSRKEEKEAKEWN